MGEIWWGCHNYFPIFSVGYISSHLLSSYCSPCFSTLLLFYVLSAQFRLITFIRTIILFIYLVPTSISNPSLMQGPMPTGYAKRWNYDHLIHKRFTCFSRQSIYPSISTRRSAYKPLDTHLVKRYECIELKCEMISDDRRDCLCIDVIYICNIGGVPGRTFVVAGYR